MQQEAIDVGMFEGFRGAITTGFENGANSFF